MVIDLNYNVRGQLTGINRAAGPVDTTLTYYNQSESFRLDEIQHGTASDATPISSTTSMTSWATSEISQMKQSGVTKTQTFEYDPVGRLTSAVGTGPTAVKPGKSSYRRPTPATLT